MSWTKLLGPALLAVALAAPAWAQISAEEEVEIGRVASSRFETQFGLSKDVKAQARLARLGAKLAPLGGRRDVPYTFKVSAMTDFNAFAFPGGFIYATQEMMKSLDDSQLAFVLGHEITHVARRHSIKQMSQQKLRQVGLLVVLATNGQQASGGQLQAAEMVDRIVGSRYSQADESEADTAAIQIMTKAGFDPAFAILALRNLARHTANTQGFFNSLIGSHPLTADRIRDASKLVPSLDFTPTPPADSEGADSLWNQVLCEDVALAPLGLQVDPTWGLQMEKLRLRKSPPGHWENLVVPAKVSLSQFETQFLGKDLPSIAQRTRRIGLLVTKNGDGGRQLYMYWP